MDFPKGCCCLDVAQWGAILSLRAYLFLWTCIFTRCLWNNPTTIAWNLFKMQMQKNKNLSISSRKLYILWVRVKLEEHFLCFLPVLGLCWTGWQPCCLSHISALLINLFYWPKDQSSSILQKNIGNWRFWKTYLFLSRPFWNLKKMLNPMKSSQRFMGKKDGLKWPDHHGPT